MNFLRRYGVALACVLLAAGCFVLGVGRGETEVVLRKAVNICMECIGLG